MAISDYRDEEDSQIAAYLFEYDSLGRLIRSTEYGASNTITQRTEHLYDEFGRLSSQNRIIQGDSFSELYTYNDPSDKSATASNATMARGVLAVPADGSLAQIRTAKRKTLYRWSILLCQLFVR